MEKARSAIAFFLEAPFCGAVIPMTQTHWGAMTFTIKSRHNMSGGELKQQRIQTQTTLEIAE